MDSRVSTLTLALGRQGSTQCRHAKKTPGTALPKNHLRPSAPPESSQPGIPFNRDITLFSTRHVKSDTVATDSAVPASQGFRGFGL